EGVADPRPPVQLACAEALCLTILDKHAYAVPAGLLVDVLGRIFAPGIVRLRDSIASAVDEEFSRSLGARGGGRGGGGGGDSADSADSASASSVSASSANSASASASASEDPWVSVDPLAVLQGELGEAAILLHCLSSLSAAFLQHLEKLSAYPSFDKLWLSILQVLAHFVDPEQRMHGEREFLMFAQAWPLLSAGTQQRARGLYAMLGGAREHLLNMLKGLSQRGVFSKRKGLLSVTRDVVAGFDGAEEYMKVLPAI
ncbi:hypothetical protein B484DRAFT_275341, partial [Ochromonadaceae sp. CCMP2298]